VLGFLLGQLVVGRTSVWGVVITCAAAVASFFAGAGVGSLLVGTALQKIGGILLGGVIICGSLWAVCALGVLVIITNDLRLPGEFWVGISALTGFLGATKWDAQPRAIERGIVDCPNCAQRLRPPLGTSGTAVCPICKGSLDCCTVNILDHRRTGVITKIWIVGVDVDRETYDDLKDRKGNLYAAIYYEDGAPRGIILNKDLWQGIRRTMMEEASGPVVSGGP
jgi:hypothetical protein